MVEMIIKKIHKKRRVEIEEDKKEKGEKPSILIWCSKFWWILVVASLLSLGLKT